MLLSQAKALSHTFIYQQSAPSKCWKKTDVIPSNLATAQDWMPIQDDPEAQPQSLSDCGCDGKTQTAPSRNESSPSDAANNTKGTA